jgi:hypothetical protein
MIVLPRDSLLVEHIRSALDAVADKNRQAGIANKDWFVEIASEIAKRVTYLGLKCYARGYGRGSPAPGCAGSEWLFDFCAVIDDEDVPAQNRFMAQAAIVGEVEWSVGGVDQDFEKLQIADSLVCFMVFQDYSKDLSERALERLTEAAERRRAYAQQRGLNRPPVFCLSCYVEPDKYFLHKVVGAAL